MAHKKRRRNTKNEDERQLRLFTTEEMSGTVEMVEEEDVEAVAKVETLPEAQSDHSGEIEPTRLLQSMRSALMMISRMKSHQVRLIAMECATLAQDGVHPDRIYKLPALEGMSMDGHDFLALYYASFAQAFPSMIDRIHLPYSDIYAQAKEKSRHLNS